MAAVDLLEDHAAQASARGVGEDREAAHRPRPVADRAFGRCVAQRTGTVAPADAIDQRDALAEGVRDPVVRHGCSSPKNLSLGIGGMRDGRIPATGRGGR
ncbi:hypothetical protein [Azohydromonas sp.]|uniref:hypothetical protein n=1 Tax=Azohydromonas sp. TaxID=1872666 RepID=UPI002B53AE7B|nr:hypothetical protein [Azohydromonas sp.]HMM86977.1 hypothetical protein [Azohydromonas sp.]